ncbi:MULTISPECIES: shikimate kinase [Mesorhizobium]|uniref:shikimate kinase n=1 Tax=Mesorhizobium TaxID=68287 RepID=UPI000BAEF04A|nr:MULTISPECIES: shikimate kinase [Mesorhizobium]PBB40575.1 shikimate kinase [Mesorhizobium sp. WSM3866]PBB59143.1 shikimate kinase [Mesorhizobium loti]PBB85158.1 shikimate kinase [Mesorhizobium sp. WSM3876]PBB89721.1 shikimate kinase [Mesorhizobium sp. WSM3864]
MGSNRELVGQAGRPDTEGGPRQISDAMSDQTREATLAIAGAVVARDGNLDGYSDSELADFVKGFSKWPDQQKTREATLAIASAVVARDGNLDGFSDPELADLVNGFSRWPDQQKTREATVAIGGVVVARDGNLDGFSNQEFANLVNGFSKWPEEEKARKAIVAIAGELGSKGRRFSTFSTPALVRIANGLSRGIEEGETAGEIAEPALLKDRLHQLAHYLQYAEDRLQQADVHAIASIFKALGKAQLLDDFGALAQPGLDRLEVLSANPGFKLDNNLETMGNLCASLLPLARSPKPVLRWHRRPALNLLNAIQPVVEHKIDAHLKAGQAERTSGPNASRCPALSIYQVLKTRAVLETLYRRPYVDGDELALQARQEELHGKTRQILDSARALIYADLSYMSWNVIAEIEAKEPLDALDTFMAQNASMVQAQHAAASFDVHRVLQGMDHEPRPPQGDAGLMRLPVVDMQGRPLASEAELRYSIFHRLTSGAVPVVAVQLKGTPTGAMLTRTLPVEGVPYRMDLFGGSKLKPPQKSLNQLASHLPFAPEEAPSGKLLAIPYAETAPGTAFEQLSRAWAPFKEAYYYTQRRGFAAPPGIPDVGPHDYALEGCFKLSLLPDRPAGAEHPFRFEGRDGEVALRPHDGCGFIRASLAERMPAIARARHDAPERMPAYADSRQSAVPPSALQHYPRSVEVAQETREKALAWLENHPSLTLEEVFRTVTGGHIEGSGAIAVPSSDECLHVPTGKSKTLTRDAGVLVGRSPYDKPNLRPFAADRVRSARDGDRTAAFLDRCVAFQYSFNVAHRSGAGLAADDPTFFAKGILIVVPDEMWPADFADRGVVMSAEDVKCHSRWLEEKNRVKADTALECVGILQATEVFAPGSLVAVPSVEQKMLDGDFDGDAVVIIGNRPRLYEHVRQFDAQLQARGVASMKPPKSHTPAIEKGDYQFSRAKQILSATGLVLETYSCLQRNVLAQPQEAQRWFAERAIFGTYEGIHPELKADIRALLQKDRPDGQTLHELITRAGEDSKAAKHPVACELAALLVAELQDWNLQLGEPAHQQSDVKQQLARSVASAGAKLAVSADAAALFPKLSESYPATADARKRIDFLLNHYQPRIDPRPDGYNPDDLHESAINLLSVGIKVGTDAYKSDTGARVFMQKTTELQRLLERRPGFKAAPYVKAQAAKLHQGRFDVDGSLADLKDNPTLAASVMEASIRLAVEKRILPSALAISADNPASRITLSSEQALERARLEAAPAEAQESAIIETVHAVAELLRQDGIEVKVPHLDQRSRGQVWIADELTGHNVSAAPEAKLVTNAVRHVFEIPDEAFTRAFRKAALAFEERDCSEVETTNWFIRMDTPRLRGVHTAFRTAQNYRFEVEFHTPASYRAELAQRAQSECELVPVPHGAWEILHWGSSGESRSRAAGTSRSATIARQQIAVAHSPQAGEIVAALGTRPVVLVGMPASGKSTIGPRLAKELGVEFVDIDKLIVAQHGNIKDIFERHGQPHFRELEARELAEQLKKGPIVIATGGGCFVKKSNRDLILEKAVSIWLDTDLQEVGRRIALQQRLTGDTGRPLLQGADIEQQLENMLEARGPDYQQADIRVVPPFKKDKKNVGTCVKELYAFLCSREREAALPAAEISHVSGASGTAISMSPTAQRMHDDHHNGHECGGGGVETIQAPAAPLSEGERPPPLDSFTADPQPLLAGNNARADLASSTRSRERSSRGQ